MNKKVKSFCCPKCGSRNLQVGSAYSFSKFIPESHRGRVRRVRRDCYCRGCKHTWASNHPLAMEAPEPMVSTHSFE